MITEFSTAVIEKLNFYVYVLIDPRNDEIFYVGKGTGNRVFQHVLCAIETDGHSEKLDRIREIGPENVKHYILRHSIDEDQAYLVESACIDLLGRDKLTNIKKGHDWWERGLKTVDEVIQFCDAKEISIDEPSVINNINRLYKRFMTSEQIYEATRSSWVVGPKRHKAEYAIASYHGMVREVFKIDYWQPKDNRWEFIGKVADPEIKEKYMNGSLKAYITKGSQNPIKYTF